MAFLPLVAGIPALTTLGGPTLETQLAMARRKKGREVAIRGLQSAAIPIEEKMMRLEQAGIKPDVTRKTRGGRMGRQGGARLSTVQDEPHPMMPMIPTVPSRIPRTKFGGRMRTVIGGPVPFGIIREFQTKMMQAVPGRFGGAVGDVLPLDTPAGPTGSLTVAGVAGSLIGAIFPIIGAFLAKKGIQAISDIIDSPTKVDDEALEADILDELEKLDLQEILELGPQTADFSGLQGVAKKGISQVSQSILDKVISGTGIMSF